MGKEKFGIQQIRLKPQKPLCQPGARITELDTENRIEVCVCRVNPKGCLLRPGTNYLLNPVVLHINTN
jgi:hypothetical protein